MWIVRFQEEKPTFVLWLLLDWFGGIGPLLVEKSMLFRLIDASYQQG